MVSHFLVWGTGRKQGGRVCWGGVGGRLVGVGVFWVRCVEVEVGVVGLVKLVLIYYELLDLGVTTRRTISRVFC